MRKFLVKIENDFLGKPIFLEGEFIANSPEEAETMAKEFYAVELNAKLKLALAKKLINKKNMCVPSFFIWKSEGIVVSLQYQITN